MKKVDITLEDVEWKYVKPSVRKRSLEILLMERNIDMGECEITEGKNNEILLRIDRKIAYETTIKHGPIIDGMNFLIKEYEEMEYEQFMEDLDQYGGLAIADWEGEYFDEDENS